MLDRAGRASLAAAAAAAQKGRAAEDHELGGHTRAGICNEAGRLTLVAPVARRNFQGWRSAGAAFLVSRDR